MGDDVPHVFYFKELLMFRIVLFIIVFMSSSVAFSAAPSAQLKKQMCFEVFPRTTFSQNGDHNWTVNEVIVDPIVYQTYQIILTGKFTDSNRFVNYGFVGHAKDKAGHEVPVNGSGYFNGTKYVFDIQYGFVGEGEGARPVVNILAFWDFYTMDGPGNGSKVTDYVDANLFNTTPPLSNTFETDVVHQIPCDRYGSSQGPVYTQ